MTDGDHLIWSNYDLDYDDWKADLEEQYPELTDEERYLMMYEINGDYLDDERTNLNIQLRQDLDVYPFHMNMDGITESERENLLKRRIATRVAMTVGMIMVLQP